MLLRRIIILLLIIIPLVVGCGASKDVGGRIEVVSRGLTWVVLVDTETGVEYITCDHGGTCMLVDADGRPLIADRYK